MPVIDVHNHIVPAEFPPAPCDCMPDKWPSMRHHAGNKASVMIGGKEFRAVDHRCWDPARRAADMDAEEVDIQVLSPMPELLSYWLDAKSGLAMARHINRAIAEMVAAAPTRFRGLGMVPLQDPDLAAKELAVLRSDYGLLGIEIGSNINGRVPGDPHFDAVFAEAERLGLAIFVHSLHPVATDRLVGPPMLVPFVNFPIDTGLAAISLITGGTLARYPKLRIGFSHGGGTLAALLPRLNFGWQNMPALHGSFAAPVEAARRFYYDNLVFEPAFCRYLIEAFGVSQLFVGSDYPFPAGRGRPRDFINQLGLSASDGEALRGGNASRFLGL
ncbi:MAG TPA: amidohydrolase family protein [Candidatus Sulfotelmatobacter sp.]|nr:amidohydrolase family protein [Candidatus Sulfotelmatobacter sp.]